MKKFLSFILTVVLAFSFLVNTSAKNVIGDVNSDNKLNSTDALEILKYSVGIIVEDFNEENADLNNDGSINSNDALLVLKISVGIIENPNDDNDNTDEDLGDIGKTWVVEDNWEITIDAVESHYFCNELSDLTIDFEEVVIIKYHYKNIGVNDEFNVSPYYDWNVYDEDMNSADVYYCSHTDEANKCIVGAKDTASEAYALKKYSNQITISMSMYDSNSRKQTKKFVVPVSYVEEPIEISPDVLVKAYVDLNYDVCDLNQGYYAISKEIIDVFYLYIEYQPSTDQLRFSLEYFGDDMYYYISLYYDYYTDSQFVEMSTVLYYEGEEYYNYVNGNIDKSCFNENYYNIYNYSALIDIESTYDFFDTTCSFLIYQSDIFLGELGIGVSMFDLGFTDLYL